MLLTNVDLESTHVLSIQLVSGIFSIAVRVILNEGVGVLIDRSRGIRYTKGGEEEEERNRII